MHYTFVPDFFSPPGGIRRRKDGDWCSPWEGETISPNKNRLHDAEISVDMPVYRAHMEISTDLNILQKIWTFSESHKQHTTSVPLYLHSLLLFRAGEDFSFVCFPHLCQEEPNLNQTQWGRGTKPRPLRQPNAGPPELSAGSDLC